MLKLINKLRVFSQDECDDAFNEPVTNDIAPGYTDEIKNPMDIATIKNKFQGH